MDIEPLKINIRQEQAAETRRNLLDSALRLFAENGYDATSVRNINRDAGVADGLLYHYFPNGKKEIIKVLALEQIERIKTLFQSDADQLDKLPLKDAIEVIYQNWLQLLIEHKNIVKILMKEHDVLKVVQRELLAEIVDNDDRVFYSLLQKRAQRGEIKEIDFGCAEDILKAVLFSYCFSILTGIGSKLLGDDEHRRKLIAYQVGLWSDASGE